MSEPALALSGITRGYGPPERRLEVLRGADLTLMPGEAVALVAPSGAGKSTLLQIAGLLDTPDGGSVRIAGQDLTGANDAARTRARATLLGFVYQFHHLLPEFSAEENVVLPQMAAGVAPEQAKARAQDLLAKVRLAERAAHRPAELSGGEQQRVAICRALVTQPKLILSDEATGNLDPDSKARILDLLFEQAAEA
ncbi:MAG: ABC transporter ATP-binding protein, partial [Pseudomonadota bacterium]